MSRSEERGKSPGIARLSALTTLIAILSANAAVVVALIAFVGFDGNRALTAHQIWIAGLLFATIAPALLCPIIVAPGLMRVRRLAQARDLWERVARQDALTGLLNRFGFDQTATVKLDDCAARRAPSVLMIADIDHFKLVNDNHGHEVGDLALEHFAALLVAAVAGRKALIGRRGGEEFAILLLDSDGEDGRRVAEQVRHICEQTSLPAHGRLLRLTASLGVAVRLGPGEPLPKLLARADAALYEAKRGGRNRVVCCPARHEPSKAA